MLKTLKGLFTKKNKDLRKRLYFTIAVLTLYIIGTGIPVPVEELNAQMSVYGFLELLDVMGGGALKRFSIFGLGVIPYITASIVIQLLQMDIIPYFSDLAKQGHTGKQKLNQITRYLGIAFALFQGFAMSFLLVSKDPLNPVALTVLQRLEISFIMTAGTAFLLWLGDQVTQKGFGNGTSLIIMAGIISSLPYELKTAFTTLVDFSGGTNAIISGSAKFLLFVLVCVLVVIGVVFVEGAARRISIQYANKSTANLGKQTYMPIKINSAGVIPVIFASSLLAVPVTIAQFVSNTGFKNFVNNYISYTTPVGLVLYILFIVFFDYFYTFIQMKPDEMAKNLKDNGGYVPGIRPGKDTEKYFSSMLIKLTTAGSVFLAIIAAFPILVNMLTDLPSSVSIGGTGLLIVVGVSIETYKQMESSLLAREYTSVTTSTRGGRGRRRARR
ncbi:MAG: preprotein translocase subunit SecY [Bacilli bacterium]|nr:preprotein translocase subunit SecY [Bacilli bacterium]